MAPKVRAGKEELIPAAVHFDGTARLQTVSRSTNPLLYAVIEKFAEFTNVPVVLNASFNLREPIHPRWMSWSSATSTAAVRKAGCLPGATQSGLPPLTTLLL